MIKRIDQTQLLLTFGARHDANDSQAVKAKKKAEKKRDILVDALFKRGTAIVASVVTKDSSK